MVDKPRITADELTKNLVNARKIMNKVDTGDYEVGNINESVLRSDPEELMKSKEVTSASKRPIGKADPNKINQSKLPDAIKKAMIDNPIPDITLNETLDMDFVNKTRRLMEQDESVTKPSSKSSNVHTISSSELERRLTPIIENVIRKTLDEIVDKKLEQILMAQNSTTLNENLAIKVGDSIFTGKITKVKNTK
jgi:hypothetical protein